MFGVTRKVSVHHNPDGTLCLEAPLTVHEVFRANETLINFVDNLLVPYLYIHSYYLKYGKLPFGEHAHGASEYRPGTQDVASRRGEGIRWSMRA